MRFFRSLLCVAFMGLVALFSLNLQPTRIALAATIIVNTTTDSNTGSNCTLRQAITAANTDTAVGGCTAGSGGDMITLPAGTYTLTLGELSVTTDIQINGPTTGTAIISGSSARIFYVSVRGLILNNLTLKNGQPPSTSRNGLGAAVYVDKGSLNATNVTFEANQASGTGFGQGLGGAIYTELSTIAGSGGLTITNCTFINNSAVRFGGAIYSVAVNNGLSSAIVRISRSVFRNNTAKDGGAIAREKGGMSITNSFFYANSATDTVDPSGGGAIDNLAINTEPELFISNTTFQRNTAVKTGGAIFNTETAKLTVDNSVFLLNSVTSTSISGGGAIGIVKGVPTNVGSVTIKNSVFSNNSATGSKGGAIYSNTGPLSLPEQEFSIESRTARFWPIRLDFLAPLLAGLSPMI